MYSTSTARAGRLPVLRWPRPRLPENTSEPVPQVLGLAYVNDLAFGVFI